MTEQYGSLGKPLVFSYRMAGGRLSPIIPIGIQLGRGWQIANFYLDSGAFYTLLYINARARFALDTGLDFRSGRKIFAQVGDGSLIPVCLQDLPMQIGGVQFRTPVGFSEKLGVAFNLLGRLGVFERFKICFHEKRRWISFQPAG